MIPTLAGYRLPEEPVRKKKANTLCDRSKRWIENWMGKSTKGMSCKEAIFLAKTYYDADKIGGFNPPKI